MALVKNHMPKFDTEILQKDFTVDDVRWKALDESTYDTAQHFVSLYDSLYFLSQTLMLVLEPYNPLPTGCNKLVLSYKNFILLHT
jgi:hypothetical protein